MSNSWIRLQLPSWRHHGRFLVWGIGRIGFAAWLFLLYASKNTFKVALTLIEMTERSTHRLLSLYDQMPYNGISQNTIEMTATPVLEGSPETILTDLVASLEGKHCLIVGDTGAGKSLIAQWLAYQVGGTVKVYDPDASPQEWQGLNVVGRCGDFDAIETAMAEDLDELQSRCELRGREGDQALQGKDMVMIAEEFPLLKDEVEPAVNWFLSHARRGRKPKVFIIALSQDDNVKTLGIEGQGGVRKCFRMLRLGKFAEVHSKSLKDATITQWLKQGKYRALLDDTPIQLPDLSSFRHQQLLPPVTPPVIHQLPPQQDTQEPEPSSNPWGLSPEKLEAVKVSLDVGLPPSRIIKEVLKFRGSKYQLGKQIIEELKAAS